MTHKEIKDPKKDGDDGICKWSFDTSPKPQNTHFSHMVLDQSSTSSLWGATMKLKYYVMFPLLQSWAFGDLPYPGCCGLPKPRSALKVQAMPSSGLGIQIEGEVVTVL